jgi:hypothetical protein
MTFYPHTQTDGETDRLRLCCNACGKTVSTPFYPVQADTPDGGLIVRAFIQCPECIAQQVTAEKGIADGSSAPEPVRLKALSERQE